MEIGGGLRVAGLSLQSGPKAHKVGNEPVAEVALLRPYVR